MRLVVPIKKHSKTGIYWYRRVIPDRLRGHVQPVAGFPDKAGRREFTITLKTRDQRHAIAKAAEIDRLVQAALDQAEAATTAAQSPAPSLSAKSDHPAHTPAMLLAAIEKWRLQQNSDQINSLFGLRRADLPRLAEQEATQNADRDRALRDGRDDVPGFYENLSAALASQGVQIAPDSALLGVVARPFALAWFNVARVRANMLHGRIHDADTLNRETAAPETTPRQSARPPQTKNGNQPFLFKINDWKKAATTALQPHQLKTYLSDIQDFSNIRANMTVSDANLSAVQDWVASLFSRGITKKTIKRKLPAINHYWRHLRVMAYIDHGPKRLTEGVDLPRTNFDPNKEDDRVNFDPGEIELLWRAALAKKKPDQPLADLIKIGALTGARVGSILDLEASDIKTVDDIRCLHFRDKTPAGNRHLPIHPALQATIDRLVKDAPKYGGFLFFSEENNNTLGRGDEIRKRFLYLARKVHHFPKEKVYHSIRMTVADLLLHADIPLHVSSTLLGHEFYNMTYSRYAKPKPSKLLKAMKKALVYEPDFMDAT